MSLNKKSIAKFEETLKVDSAHPDARSALAHSLYMDKQFNEAIRWFEQANKINGDAAINYREMGLCKINIGQIKNGKADIDSAFLMDRTAEIRNITIDDLTDIGNLAFAYGDGYIKQGESEKGNDYKKFSISVLILAHQYDTSRTEIAAKIAEYAEKIGDKAVAEEYKK